MPLYVFDANEANKLTKDSIKKNNEQKLEQLLDCIQSRAIDGYFNLTLWEPLSPENKEFLITNGYKIRKMPSNYCTYKGGQETILTTIDWE